MKFPIGVSISCLAATVVLVSASSQQVPGLAPGSPAFQLRQLDDGQSETAALADVNNDGALDIVSSAYWYEAPNWTRRPIRDIPVTSGYVDNFSDLPVDVDGDGFVDLVQIGYFARRLVWVRNPGREATTWTEHEIESIGPTEFAFLVDLNNDGKAEELLPQFTSRMLPLVWYELQDGAWTRHVVGPESHGHGIGAGDVNGDGRADIVTPEGWFEAPADVPAATVWTFHPTDWLEPQIAIGSRAPGAATASGPTGGARGRGRGMAPARIEFGFMHVIDLNEDGRNDILTTMAHSFGVLWFEQKADGTWQEHLIDNRWSRAHASTLVDLNGDGRRDLVTGARYMGRNQPETEPLAMYWYEYRPGPTVTWTRHAISEGGDAGGGLQIAAGDIGNDGDVDLVSAGKSGLFLYER